MVDEKGVPVENHRPAKVPDWQTLLHNVVLSTKNVHLAWVGLELTTLVVIGTDTIA